MLLRRIDTSKGVTAHCMSGSRQAGAPEETAGEARPDLLEELRPAATSDSALIWKPLGVKRGERESSLSNFGIKRRIYLPSQLSICLRRRVADLPSVVLPPGWRRNLHPSFYCLQKQTIKRGVGGACLYGKTCIFLVDYGECFNYWDTKTTHCEY